MAADNEGQTKHPPDHDESSRTDTLNPIDNPTIRRSCWAKKSRELKKSPWRFPSDTGLAAPDNEQSVSTEDTVETEQAPQKAVFYTGNTLEKEESEQPPQKVVFFTGNTIEKESEQPPQKVVFYTGNTIEKESEQPPRNVVFSTGNIDEKESEQPPQKVMFYTGNTIETELKQPPQKVMFHTGNTIEKESEQPPQKVVFRTGNCTETESEQPPQKVVFSTGKPLENELKQPPQKVMFYTGNTIDTEPEQPLQNVVFSTGNTIETESKQPSQKVVLGGASVGNFDDGDYHKQRCKFFLQMSLNIDSVDSIDGVCGEGDTECLEAVDFLKSVPAETRTMVAKYLSTGNPEHLTITKDNLHGVFHLAKMLNLIQLYNQCMKFCMKEDDSTVVPLFDNCECAQDIIQESKTGYQRFVSIVASKEGDKSPEFYVAISEEGSETKRKRILKVIDMVTRTEIFQRDIQNMQQLGNGSDACCCYKKESPYVFACGGEGKSAQLCWKYDVLLGRWNKCAKMLQARSNHRVVSTGNGSVFVVGGTDTLTIDEYSISANKWTTCAALQKHVQSPICAVYSGKIFIFGGKTAAGPVATVQCYDKATQRVSCLPDLPCEFVDGKVALFEDRLYIATDQGHMIGFVPETGESYLCSQQPVQRSNFGMFVKNERIYLLGGVARGGHDGPAQTQMYRYNPKKDSWTAEPDLNQSFPVLSSCVIRYPKNCPVVPFNDKF